MASNRLAAETSPYLRQHRDNPVDWYPWGAEAFATAAERQRPILLSIGYSACHWCHVMAHECFEDAEVAAAMNELFVNVKVDREERPDVDAVYMDAVQALTGHGGWPMTVFLTPDGKPFYGGTYFPKPQFLQLMAGIDEVWRTRPDDVVQNTSALLAAIGRSAQVEPLPEPPGLEAVQGAVDQLLGSFDARWGGFGAAPKFPAAASVDLLTRLYVHDRHGRLEEVITTTLDAMASGGMYDHIGGGFARYSVDERWLVPHFEKMLYDQALLVRAYVHAYAAFGHERWRQVASETIGYVLRDLRHPDGGLYSAEDADSPDEHGHGHEGLFHTWTEEEVRAVLGDDAGHALEWYEFEAGGNFEGRTIPARLHHRGQLARPPEVERARARLFEAREQRRRPGLDDKVLTEWNAMMLSSLSEAAGILDDAQLVHAASQTGEFLVRELRDERGRWFRSWQADGRPKARHAALAGDHATLVDAFTRLGEASGEARWIDEACAVADVMLDHFWDPTNGGLYTTADDAEQLVVRQKELLDGATPSANSTAAIALLRLGALTDERRYSHHADQILQLLGGIARAAPAACANGVAAIELRRRGITEVAVVGDRRDLLRAVQHTWRPSVVLAWGEPYESPLWSDRDAGFAYVCRQFTCDRPAADVALLEQQLAGR